MRYRLSFFVVAASAAFAQSSLDPTWNPSSPIAPASAVLRTPPVQSLSSSWSDNFDRANNTVLGPDWTQMTGGGGINNNHGKGIGTANSWAEHNSAVLAAVGDYKDAVASIDFLPPAAPNVVYVAVAFGTGGPSNDSIFVKVQDNSSAGNYNRAYFYRGINGGGPTGPSGSFPLTTPVTSGRMTVYFTNAGDTCVLDIDSDFNGVPEQSYSMTGYLSVPPSGDGVGVATFREPEFDNWSFSNGALSGPITYCTAGTTTNGCNALVSASNNPSATQAQSCAITIASVEGQKSGIIFYGLTSLVQPWCTLGGGSSFLCVKPPTQRTLVQSSGGTTAQCDGSLTLDWDAFQLANPGALGQPWVAGQKAFVQGWFRDPAACKTTSTSDALELTYLP
ncbi:MAG: hypothetical protein IT454_22925 [Planctomycetes bacterium]|nr:hypothetical protein [Planctomycetota bacterium]